MTSDKPALPNLKQTFHAISWHCGGEALYYGDMSVVTREEYDQLRVAAEQSIAKLEQERDAYKVMPAAESAQQKDERDLPYGPPTYGPAQPGKEIKRADCWSQGQSHDFLGWECRKCGAIRAGEAMPKNVEEIVDCAPQILEIDEEGKVHEPARTETPQTLGPLKLDTDSQVFFYEQDHYYLSSFSSFKVNYLGIIFPAAEYAYHWRRFHWGSPEQRIIIESASAHDAFRFAQEHKDRQVPNWNKIKVDVMREIIRAKVTQHEYVRRKLLQTGDRELIENSWRDDFWGWGQNRDGQNMLGKLWMEVRELIRIEGVTK